MRGHYKDCSTDPADCWCKVRRYSHVLVVAGIIIAIQVFAGWFSGSIALLSDAGHTAFDSTGTIVVLIAALFVRFGSSAKRADNKAFFLNILLLFFAVGFITYEAIDRLFGNERAIVSWVMIIAGFIGGIGNFIQHSILEGAAEEHKDRAHKSQSFHYLTDIVTSAGVVVGGIAIYMTGYSVIDPILSLGIASWILWGTIKLIRNRAT
ncbi:MAG: cation diffusion facilitator family transporter [Parcubacteria group bacterium]|nr:cation diffusion facilitator family transporter [Parcubacteria group bacterium]